MKRKYVIFSAYMCAVVLLSGLCYGSYRYSENVDRQRQEQLAEREAEAAERTKEVSASEVKITSETKYVVEIYNRDTEDTIREERTMPSEFAGMTRDELEDYLVRYMEAVEELEQDTGLVDLELLSFSKNEVLIRKTYKEEEERGFFLKLVNGEVVIFDETGQMVYENTGIRESSLPEEEIRKLKKGYAVESEKVLYSILENYSS